MAKRDYYEVLGVSKDSDGRALKVAYRKLAMEHHPDRNQDDPEAEEKFKECAEAYAALSDPEKRATYDRYGHEGLKGGGFADPGDVFTHFQDFFGDFFNGFGGGRSRRDGPSRGEDVRAVVELTYQDCMLGAQKDLELRHPSPCEPCSGTGAKDGKLDRCNTCGGVGRVAQRSGHYVMQVACPTCRGQGSTAAERCSVCEGAGRVPKERTVRASVPAGIADGQQLRLSGKGQAGTRGGPAGDLYVTVRVIAEKGFSRDGYDLIHELILSYPQAALGAKKKVPSLVEGKPPTEVTVPAGMQPGETLVIRSEGFPRLDGRGDGDLICVINVDVPKELSDKARTLIEQLASSFDS